MAVQPFALIASLLLAPAGTAPFAAVSSDTSDVHHRVVREFPPIEVRALLPDMRSSQTAHPIPQAVLRTSPAGSLAEIIALQPGVVAQAEELHVRGGRAGEMVTMLDGMSLVEPLRGRSIDVPLLSLRDAELVSGTPEARYGGGLAGVLDLRSDDPGRRASAEWHWQTDGRAGTHYDRLATRLSSPLGVLGLGAIASGEATLDDTHLPMLRSTTRHRVAGVSLGWRAENRLLAHLKLAPVKHPERFSAQFLMGRALHRPYSPDWSLDGWVFVPVNFKTSPTFSPVPLPGYTRYRAADHLAVTDDHQMAALVRSGFTRGITRGDAGLGWLRTRTVTSVDGRRHPLTETHRPMYGRPDDRDGFHVLWGDYPLYRESGADVLSLVGDVEVRTPAGAGLRTGAGLTYERVTLDEIDWLPRGTRTFEPGDPFPLDSVRSYRAGAPGGYAYAQGRWQSGGMVLNGGLRAEYFTAGPERRNQTLPGNAGGTWTLAPRLGIAYPISVRDVFSLAYVRLHQPPGRDFLYDRRVAITDRQPLGNPALAPSTMISYEAAVKHLLGDSWALQTSVFYRDVYGQVGALDYALPLGPTNLRYMNADQSHALGFEWSLFHATARTRFEAHYTWLNAYGNESRPEGDPYGPVRLAVAPPIGDQPLSWDRRHTIVLSGAWRWPSGIAVAWSTLAASPLPWTPKPRRQIFVDWGLVNRGRLAWTEVTDLDVSWTPRQVRAVTVGLQVRNLFDETIERAVTVDGYPNPIVNTYYDDYSAYRTETGQGGGAYWSQLLGETAHWVPVHDARLDGPPRTIRATVSTRW